MPPRKSTILLTPYISIRKCITYLQVVFFQIVVILLLANSLQAAAIFEPSSPEISGEEAKKLGAKLADDIMYLGDIILYPTGVDKYAIGGVLWPGGTLVYDFSHGLDPSKEQAFRDACKDWTLNASGIVCQQRTTEADFVLISEHDGSGCGGDAANVSCSALGMIGGSQNLEVFEDHWTAAGVLQHQIGHSLGLIHEHGRRDRDSFVDIMGGNIRSGQEGQFEVTDSAFSTDYDLLSIMHYRNCTFSKHDSCNLPNKAYHTIVPASCHLDEVGGKTITALDVESMRNAYAPNLHAIFPQQRDRRCGVLDYSLKQLDQTCAPHCVTIGDTMNEKGETKTDSWCGWVPYFEYQDYCSADRTYSNHRWEYEYFSCGWLRTRSQVEIQCGCPHTLALAQCAITTGPIILSKLQDLLDSNVPKDVNAGRFVKRVLAFQDNGNLETGLSSKIGDFLFDNYNQHGFSDSVKNLTCLVKIFMAGKLFTNPTYKLSLPSLRNLANQTGLRTHSL